MSNTTCINSTMDEQDQQNNLFLVSLKLLRFFSIFAVLMNLCVLVFLIRLKRTFRSYSHWFQVLVLVDTDLFNGMVSFTFSFRHYKVFKSNYIACSVIIWAYLWCQINTLLAMCYICVNRFRSLQNIRKLTREKRRVCQQISIILLVSIVSIVYSCVPFYLWNITKTYLPSCTGAYLFGFRKRCFKIFMSLGLMVPLTIINMLYGICLFKLQCVSLAVSPVILQSIRKTGFQSQQRIDAQDQNEIPVPLPGNGADPLFQNKSSPSNSDSSSFPKTDHRSTEKDASSASETGQDTRTVRRQKQVRAIKMLGMILFLTDITTIVPVAALLRDVFSAEDGDTSGGGGTPLGVIFLSLNSLVDSFVYGLYTTEIRSFLRQKFMDLRRCAGSNYT